MGVPYAEVIGDPVAHSKSPLIHKFWLDKLGIEGDYRRVRVRADELADYFTVRRVDPDWRGCNVTIPHKEAIIPLLDESGDCGIGATNCVLVRDGLLIGRNTDGLGVDKALSVGFRAGVDTSAPVCLIGAGGAARAAIASLDVLAVDQCNIVVRNYEQGRRLLDAFHMDGKVFTFDEAAAALRDCAGVINASPLGMAGRHAMPGSVLSGIRGMNSNAFAFDMVYTPIWTELLQRADEAGFETVDGLTMLIGQAEQAFFHFFGSAAPVESEADLRDILTR